VYTSDESGRSEVYVQPFPGPGGRWQVSTEGAEWVEWYKDLMYGRSEEVVMSVPYRVAGNAFVAEKPRVWMRIPPGVLWLDPAPDSSRAGHPFGGSRGRVVGAARQLLRPSAAAHDAGQPMITPA
jgi:hypothetical protein